MILIKVFACMGVAAALTAVAAVWLYRDWLIQSELEAAQMGGGDDD